MYLLEKAKTTNNRTILSLTRFRRIISIYDTKYMYYENSIYFLMDLTISCVNTFFYKFEQT